MILKNVLPVFALLVGAIVFVSCGDDKPTEPPKTSKPVALQVVNGEFYKGIMGSSVLAPELTFKVVDSSNRAVKSTWVHFSLIEGDGDLVHDSLQSNDAGQVTAHYDFSGDVGHATLRALIRNVDTAQVFLRASTITPGVNGQGHYILFSDDFATVKLLLGNPAGVDVDPFQYLNYAVYEAALGVVVMIADTNRNNTAQDYEPVVGVIVNTIYTGTTAAGWGVGSLITTALADLGAADTVTYDPIEPAAYRYKWNSDGATVYTSTEANEASRTIIEIHVYEPAAPATAPIRRQAVGH